MSITEEQFRFMKDGTTSDLVQMLMQKRPVDMIEALDLVYTSQTYRALSSPRTNLYFQSPGYVYEYLQDELERNKR